MLVLDRLGFVRSECKPLVSYVDYLNVNFAIRKNAYLWLPVADDGHGEWLQAGRGQPTSPLCGKHTSWYVCRDKESHKSVVFEGIDYTGKVAVSHGHLWCHKTLCPVCFLKGWVLREARAIVGKMDAGVEKGYGEVEHFSVSFPPEMWDLPESVLRVKAERALLVRGVLGGALMFHGRRKSKKKGGLYWSPHYHGLGFVRGGYDVCRECTNVRPHDCWGCGGFEGRTRRENEKDSCVVRVFGKRKTVIGTATYQLSHVSVRVGLKRFHVVSYFGVCSNKRLKSHKVQAVEVCPVCASVKVENVMVRCCHWGKEFVATNIGDPRYESCFASEEFDSSGLPIWVDFGGGSSE